MKIHSRQSSDTHSGNEWTSKSESTETFVKLTLSPRLNSPSVTCECKFRTLHFNIVADARVNAPHQIPKLSISRVRRDGVRCLSLNAVKLTLITPQVHRVTVFRNVCLTITSAQDVRLAAGGATLINKVPPQEPLESEDLWAVVTSFPIAECEGGCFQTG